MNHLTRERLERWRDHGAEADRQQVISHLAVCDECGALYAEMIRTSPAGVAAASLNPDQFARRGHRVYRSAPRGWRAFMWRPIPIAATTALLLLAALLLPAIFRETPGTSTDDRIRGSELQLLEPTGRVPVPFQFRWRSPIAASSFQLEVYDSQDRRVYSTRVTGEDAPLGADLRRQLQTGAQYRWAVTALDGRGEAIMTSDSQVFVVASSQ